jgi:hypothetical protein
MFWLADGARILVLWEYSHRRSNNERGFIAMIHRGLLWYIFSVECLVGVFFLELIFSHQKGPRPKMSAGRWCPVVPTAATTR